MTHYMYNRRKLEIYGIDAFENWKGLVTESPFENVDVFFPCYFSKKLTISLENEETSITYKESIKKKYFTPSL
jgi:hypothetical protein